ncbi:solute carrier family 23 protein [Escherichia coli]
MLANGLNSFVSVGLAPSRPRFGQNNGVIQLTGVASHVGFVVALMLIRLGLFPQ